nr:porin [uncultured Cupriavidus sp.]
MKSRNWAACLLCATPLVAAAQSVTLYGVIDTGVEFVNGIGASRNSVVRMPSLTATVPSRWGLRGSEDLGGGLKSVFVLESGFAPDSGTSNQGGRLFGRQAFVGLSSNQWGQISFGRQWTMTFWSTLDSDILGPNIYGANSLDSYRPNARADNAIAYKGVFGGLTVGATYSLGRDTVNAGQNPAGTNCAGENPADKQACREWSVMLRYDASKWGVATAYDSLRGGAGAAAGLTSSSLKDDRLHFGGYMLLGDAKIGIGGTFRNNEGSPTSHSQLYYAGVAYDVTPAFNLAGQVYYLGFRNSANKAWLAAVRGTYAFSKRTSAYVTGGFIDNRGQSALSVSSGGSAGTTTPAPGSNQFGAMLGVKHTF